MLPWIPLIYLLMLIFIELNPMLNYIFILSRSNNSFDKTFRTGIRAQIYFSEKVEHIPLDVFKKNWFCHFKTVWKFSAHAVYPRGNSAQKSKRWQFLYLKEMVDNGLLWHCCIYVSFILPHGYFPWVAGGPQVVF